jgi:hypothetical protein
MLWGWILKRCTDDVENTGLWGYLASRARDKSRVNLDRSHTEGTMRLVDRLPYGAVVREGTADTWREIRMPDPPQPPIFLSMEPQAPAATGEKPTELEPSPVSRELDGNDNPEQRESP